MVGKKRSEYRRAFIARKSSAELMREAKRKIEFRQGRRLNDFYLHKDFNLPDASERDGSEIGNKDRERFAVWPLLFVCVVVRLLLIVIIEPKRTKVRSISKLL